MLRSVQSNNTCSVVKVEKGKFHPRTVHEGREGECMYRSTLSLTSALDGEWVINTTSWLTCGKDTHYSLYRRLGGPQGCVEECGKSHPNHDSIPELSVSVFYLHHKHSEITPNSYGLNEKWQGKYMKQGQYMVFRAAMPCSLVDRCCVGVTYRFHLQDKQFSSVGKYCVNIGNGGLGWRP